MSTEHLPKTDSIEELTRFWDTHDLTDFEGELEEVSDQVFNREKVIPVRLLPEFAEAVRQMAKSEGVEEAKLIELWVMERTRSLSPSRVPQP